MNLIQIPKKKKNENDSVSSSITAIKLQITVYVVERECVVHQSVTSDALTMAV
jgi:hypothetical protein